MLQSHLKLVQNIVHIPQIRRMRQQIVTQVFFLNSFAQLYKMCRTQGMGVCVLNMCHATCECLSLSLCMSFLSAGRIMTSNTNPLDWDYSSSGEVAGKPQTDDWTSLDCFTRQCHLQSFPHTTFMTSSVRSTLSFYQRS